MGPSPRDLLDNVVVKVADEVEVDISTHAWKVSYQEAFPTALDTLIDQVRVPYILLARREAMEQIAEAVQRIHAHAAALEKPS